MNHASSVISSTSIRRASAFMALVVLAVGLSGCNKLKARDQLNKGVAAFKNAQYDTAIEHFKQAKELDPGLMNARLYLATAYASQYIPGAPSEQNMRLGTQAVNEFKEVLEKEPSNLSAIDGIGSIIFQMAGQPYAPKKFEESKAYHQRHIDFLLLDRRHRLDALLPGQRRVARRVQQEQHQEAGERDGSASRVRACGLHRQVWKARR